MADTVNITINEWAEDLLQELSEFTVSIWKEERPNLQVDRLVNWFKNLDLKYPPIAIIARIDKKIVGWIFFVQMTTTEAEINPWAMNGHPIVLKEYENDYSIIQNLIAKTIEYGISEGLTRIELSFMESDGEKKTDYQTLGMHLVERNCHMRQELSQKIDFTGFPENLTVVPISQLDTEKFYQCFLETFRASQDIWLNDKSDAEIYDYFHEVVLEKDFPLIEPASIGISTNGQLIAFSIVRESHGDENGQLWIMGVHSNYRRKGIGRNIIHHIKSTLKQKGYKTTSLNVNLTNIPAKTLYLSEGYVEDWIQISYAWKPEK
ncbi:MAG: GNAT family N-acetyltransferase [Candidatus Heimdallarchaeota archaeon]|nr:MAG: GNAT family N-acetyltransferase [Candidatus Heimdallarchaeota archaeon]